MRHAHRDGSPPRGKHLVRRYGLYSSRGHGTWKDRPQDRALRRPALGARAPASGYGRMASAEPTLPKATYDREVDALCSPSAWARRLAKVHAIDVLACPRCGSHMPVIAVRPITHRSAGLLAQPKGSSPASIATVGDPLPLDEQVARHTFILDRPNYHGSSTSIWDRDSSIGYRSASHVGDSAVDCDDFCPTTSPRSRRQSTSRQGRARFVAADPAMGDNLTYQSALLDSPGGRGMMPP
jgi:hypothetical protein